MIIDQFEKWLNHQIEHSCAAGEAAPKMDIMYARGRRAALDAARRELERLSLITAYEGKVPVGRAATNINLIA